MQQKSKVIERAKLLNTLLEKNSSDRIHELVSQRIASIDQYNHEAREAEAKRLCEIITSSKTEAEMVRRIEELD